MDTSSFDHGNRISTTEGACSPLAERCYYRPESCEGGDGHGISKGSFQLRSDLLAVKCSAMLCATRIFAMKGASYISAMVASDEDYTGLIGSDVKVVRKVGQMITLRLEVRGSYLPRARR